MRLAEFEHLLAAAASVSGHRDLVVIGSQAILGLYTTPPSSMVRSMEADVFAPDDPGAADVIDGALGDGSPFHRVYGYYAHGVGRETAKAPRGWEERLVRRDIPARPGSQHGAVAWCLEAHDLVLSKCVAGRDRDWEFAAAAILATLVSVDRLIAAIDDLPIDEARRDHVEQMLRAIATTR